MRIPALAALALCFACAHPARRQDAAAPAPQPAPAPAAPDRAADRAPARPHAPPPAAAPPAAEPGRGEERAPRACEPGSGETCRRLDRLLAADDTTPADLAAQEPALRAACERGTGDACLALATMHLLALGVPESPEQVRALLGRACEARSAVGCLRLGLILVAFPAGGDGEQGPRLVERACALGAPLGCVRSAEATLRELGAGAPGAERALERLRAACRAGEDTGCVALAAAHRDGRGVPRDPAKARALLEAACREGRARACTALGATLADAPATRVEALRAWRRGCQLRDGEACLRVAQTLHVLPGLRGPAPDRPDLPGAVRLVQQACTLHAPEGCSTLAELHLRGLGVARDSRRAVELATRACRLGAETGCERSYLARALR